MFKNYFKTAVRNIIRHKGFSFINITGLAIGLAACMLIVQYVSFELSYDTFHKDADNIYRLRFDRVRNGKEDNSAGTSPGMGPLLKENLPGIASFARFKSMDYMNNLVKYGDIQHNQPNVYFADPEFLSLFNFPAVSGQPAKALVEPNTAVITQTAATRYFGKENPVGKVITITNQYGNNPFTITSLLKDLPGNTHIHFDLLLSYKTLINLDPEAKGTMGWNAFFTYVQLNAGTNTKSFEASANKLARGIMAEDMRAYKYNLTLALQPVKEIHLYPTLLRHDAEIKGNRKTIYILITVALFILVIAYFNYINLSTSRATNRAKEVGIRKVAGSGRFQLIKQFLFESALLNSIAFIIAIFFIRLSIPWLNQLTGKEFSFGALFTSDALLVLITLFFTGSALSGLYPAFILSSFKPAAVLKGKSGKLVQGAWLRKGLVVMQFTVSALLIAGTIAVYKQVNYMSNHELGINIDETLVIKAPAIQEQGIIEKKKSFAGELKKYAGIKTVTASAEIPGNEITRVSNIFRTGSDGQKNSYSTHFLGIDDNFLPSYAIKLLAGRNFSADRPTDKDAIILSETALQSYGFSTPAEALGVRLEEFNNHYFTVIGVAKDYHHTSLKTNLKPIAYLLDENFTNYYSLKIQAADAAQLKSMLAGIETKWKTFFSGSPLDYFFLDDFFNRQYKADKQFGKIFTVFAGLAIFIACMGLFGLVSFSTVQRTKEIGIRKVLGASVPGILNLLSRDFIKLILVANVLAIPLIYLSINKWLQNYPYRVNISWWMFVLPAVTVLLIAMLTVSYQAFKTATSNPVKALRSE